MHCAGVAFAVIVLAAAAQAAETQAPIAVRPGGLLPCEELAGQAVQMGRPNPIVVPRADGNLTALFFYSFPDEAKRPEEVVYADLVTGKVRTESLPAGIGNPWPHLWGPDGRLYLGLWGPATLLRYDPAKDKVETFGVIEPDGSSVPILVIGTDEKIYALCSAKAHVFSFDPKDDVVVRYGAQGPKRNYPIAYRGSLGVDDEYIYSTFGNIPNETFTVAMKKATREWKLIEGIQGAQIMQGRLGVTAVLDKKEYWLYQGQAIPKQAKDVVSPSPERDVVAARKASPQGQAIPKQAQDEKPPWPERPLAERRAPPAAKGKFETLPNSVDTQADGRTRIWYRLAPKEAWRALEFQGKPEAMFLRSIGVLSDGRLFATTTYNGIYAYDPKAGRLEHQGIMPCSNYAARVVGGRVYLVSYPGGSSLFVWDPARPWTIDRATPDRAVPAINAAVSNPRQLPVLIHGVKDAPLGFQHPWFMAHGMDHALYVAIHGERYNVGSLIAWRELDTGESGFLRKSFEQYDPDGLCPALDGSKLVYGTRAIEGLKGEPKPASGRLFVIDVATRKVDWTLDPFPGVDSAGMPIEGKPGEVIVAALKKGTWEHERKLLHEAQETEAVSVLYKVDLKTRAVTRSVEVSGFLAGRREYYWLVEMAKGPDGMIYTFHNDTLVRIDPDTLAITAISKVGAIGRFAFAGKDIYLSGTSHLRVVRNTLLP